MSKNVLIQFHKPLIGRSWLSLNWRLQASWVTLAIREIIRVICSLWTLTKRVWENKLDHTSFMTPGPSVMAFLLTSSVESPSKDHNSCSCPRVASFNKGHQSNLSNTTWCELGPESFYVHLATFFKIRSSSCWYYDAFFSNSL